MQFPNYEFTFGSKTKNSCIPTVDEFGDLPCKESKKVLPSSKTPRFEGMSDVISHNKLVIINDKKRFIWNLGVVPFDVNGQLFLSWGVNGEPILMNQYKIVVGTVQSNNGKYITYIDKLSRRRKVSCHKIRRLY